MSRTNISRRHFAKATALGTASLALPRPSRAATAKKPNVLFIFTDDQRADTIGALGNPHIKTPNLDRLARFSFVFRNTYIMGSNIPAVCLPSRNMLMSGRAYFRFERYASGNAPNFPDSMKEAGYETYHHGKRGNVALEIEKRFDTSKYLNDRADRTSGEPGKTIVDDAIQFLESRTSARPFFMYLAFANPHDPRVAAERYMRMYRREDIPLPQNYMPVHPFNNGEMTVRDELLAPWPRTRDEVRKQLHEYYATISGMDYHIGRLLDALQKNKLHENTIIVFSSDNGLALGSHGLMGKQSLYEHSWKVPLMFTGPGIRNGRSDALVYLHDVMPSVLDLVGGKIPPNLDGASLSPVMEGRRTVLRDSIFGAYRSVQRAVRDERWKLIRYPHINRTQLFDLAADPYELKDLSAEAGQASRIQRMMSLIGDWQKKVGDNLPLTSANPQDPTFTPPSGEELKAKSKRAKPRK